MHSLIYWTENHNHYQQQVSLVLLRFVLLISLPALSIVLVWQLVELAFLPVLVGLLSLGLILYSGHLTLRSAGTHISSHLWLGGMYLLYLLSLLSLPAQHFAFLWFLCLPVFIVFFNPPKPMFFWSLALVAPLLLIWLLSFFGTTVLPTSMVANLILGITLSTILLAYLKQQFFVDQLKLKYKHQQLAFNRELIDQKVPILSLDLSGRILQANSAFMEITGYRRMALIGKTLDQLDLLNADLSHFSLHHIIKNKIWSGELHGRRRSGAQFWMQVTIREEFNAQFEKVGYMALCEDITAQQLLKLHANHDQLTGALNRRVFDQFIHKSVLEFQRYRDPFSLIICDIDHFKHVNDTYGHNFGDQILKELYAELSQILRASDTICRWGGEEFAILLPRTGLDKAVAVAEKIREHISQTEFSGQYPLTISLGVSELRLDDKPENWFERADQALYTAKETGRNRVCFT
ncbi:MAG: sensor domain-containing diguanylate cyclase [Thiotrichales bacterium]|nr:sensor domain-containing diguanylate cyclase [Thiotrichales bacterium]